VNGAPQEDWRGARIGILGGTFDPPHVAHVRMGVAARDALSLDRVFYSPAPHPPHKRGEPVLPWEHRRAMIAAAVADEPGLAVTDIESGHDPSYTVDLLRAAAARTSADLYLIVGADSLAAFGAWHEPLEILRLCTLVVFPRDDRAPRLALDGPASLVVFESPRLDVSSSAVRDALATGDAGGARLVPAPVAAYIARYQLYRRL